jgi:integrase
METSFDVRVFKLEVYEGKKRTTFYVRWKVGGKRQCEVFEHFAQADAFRSELITAARKGEAFDVASGLPLSKLKAKRSKVTWYEFAIEYADRRWPRVSASQRKNTAQVLMTVTVVLCSGTAHDFDPVKVRTALREWAFNRERRDDAPADVAAVLAWAKRAAPSMSVWTDTEVIRAALDAVATTLTGKSAASSSVRRDRSILSNVLTSAVERKVLDTHPFTVVKVDKVKSSRAVDKRCLLNPRQAKALLDWVKARPRNGATLHAFFAVLYYAGLRPEEAVMLRVQDLTLPEDGWGEILAHTAAAEVGRQWTDSGKRRDERKQLKGRDRGEVRPVPAHPALCRILRAYIAHPNPRSKEPPKPLKRTDHLFRGERGGDLAGIVYHRNWQKARNEVLAPDELDSPLGRRVYDLRHTCLTTWLNSGVPAAQVAAWAGNSVPVLLATYVNCISGSEEALKRRIEDALPDEEPEEGAA